MSTCSWRESVRPSPDAEPTTVTLDSDPRVTAAVALGQRGTVFVNPYTGDVLGSGSARARAFYRSVTSWHRYLSVEGENRATARAITGACNAAFLVLALSGIYLWWPKQWTWRHVSRGHAVPIGAERQGQGLQLAQRDWVLVRADPRDSDRLRHGHFLHLGEQPGLHGDRQPEACAGCRARRRTRWRNRRRARRPRRAGRVAATFPGRKRRVEPSLGVASQRAASRPQPIARRIPRWRRSRRSLRAPSNRFRPGAP